MTTKLDHVIYGARDLEATALRFREEFGLDATEGGVHPGGTKNWGVFFSDGSYLELLGVHDPSLPMGSRLARRLDRAGDGLFAWAVRTDDLDAVADRLGLEVANGSIERSDGSTGSWRLAGVEAATAEPALPFYIQYAAADGPSRRPEPTGDGVAWVEVSGDEGRIREWLGDIDFDVRVVEGKPALCAVGIKRAGAEIVVRSGLGPDQSLTAD